jgi:hypothetical protein
VRLRANRELLDRESGSKWTPSSQDEAQNAAALCRIRRHLPTSPLRMKKKLIMVMGVQRSGTTVLFKSLARDPALTSFNESADDRMYYLYRLRPLDEIAPILDAAPGSILLKPITETFYRSLDEVRQEFADYILHFVWIYRDPMNVLLSMSRKGWLSSGLDGEQGAGNWVTRNRLALQFQKEHPAEIAIVRYEDLICDRQVFQSLCQSLGINGIPNFRSDRGNGRRDLPADVQAAIHNVTRQTLRALDAARTFKPRPFRQLKAVATAKLSRPAKRSAPTEAAVSPSAWKHGVATAAPKAASELEGLFFWLDAGQLSAANSRIEVAQERGPLALSGEADRQPPFCFPFLNGQPALFFPTNKALERRQGDHGLLRFVVPATKADSLICGSFSVIALIKPHLPKETCPSQTRVVAMCIRSETQAAKFKLEWDRELRASRAILELGHRSFSVTTGRGSHPHQKWRLVYFHFRNGRNPELLLSVDGMQGLAPLPRFEAPLDSPSQSDWMIELGGSESDPNALFYGAIAELVLVRRALSETEQFEIASYVKQKYGL